MLLVTFLVLVPWIPVGDRPAFQFDVPARRVYALGAIYTASDAFLIALFAFFAAFSLFFFTSLFGRLWCGYTCPQSVFLEEFIRPIEQAFEGHRSTRMLRDAGPWNLDKAWRKVGKWSAFAALAIAISTSFMAWFTGPTVIWTGAASGTAYALVGFFATLWFLDFVWFREQLCNYLCPYARFQGALADDESLVVTYDARRGEPRGKAARARGGCIDCKKCVIVCPAGIDIRDGYQLECTSCARCIDACDSVMTKLGHPSLVAYGSVAALEGKKPRIIRPRTVLYAGLLSAVGSGIVAMLALHEPIEVTVERMPGTLYTLDDDGWIRNTFLLKVVNKRGGSGSEQFSVAIDGLHDAELVVPPVELASSEARTVPLVVRVRANDALPRTIPFRVRVASGAGAEVEQPTTFKTPGG